MTMAIKASAIKKSFMGTPGEKDVQVGKEVSLEN